MWSAERVSATTSTGGARGGGGVILSPRGKMFAHDDSRKLFVTDTVAVLESIRKMLAEMDIPTKQVLIEARIVEATTGFTNSFGMRLTGFNFQQQGYQVPGTDTRAVFFRQVCRPPETTSTSMAPIPTPAA
jgi:type IV pilus assembly protein PilQ